MVDVELRSPIFNEETGKIEVRSRALVRADGSEIQIYRPVDAPGDCTEVIDTSMQVVDHLTGEVVSSEDDAERWARNLPFAFRAGDLVAVITHDDDPPSPPSANGHDEDPLPEIPAPPVAEAQASAR